MEEEIIRLIRQKDEKGIELIAHHYEKLIRYIAATILRDRDSAVEECLNDVYLKIWTYGAQYDYQKCFEAFIFSSSFREIKNIKTEI
jgi:RNA polymerase sigma-70 factor (ECF subfamily)